MPHSTSHPPSFPPSLHPSLLHALFGREGESKEEKEEPRSSLLMVFEGKSLGEVNVVENPRSIMAHPLLPLPPQNRSRPTARYGPLILNIAVPLISLTIHTSPHHPSHPIPFSPHPEY
ncbi:hypothetical protein E2C01_045846 [Portunus trituberculatus]|uniref:Uncharacterized protein n=1 Tax=Portunus trituberculatus TaxID=210409 RepID=A0A5B7G482_PORTR|nr:hypothetical protein [Portunus trituberculatus]